MISRENTGGFKNLMTILILIGVISIFFTQVSAASYEDVRLYPISLNDTNIGPGDDVILTIKIENKEGKPITVDIEIFEVLDEDDEDKDISLKKDNKELATGETKEFNYSLNNFNKWDPYICGDDRIIKVIVEGEEDTDKLDVSGKDFRIDISPDDDVSVSDTIEIEVKDRSSDEVKGEKIRITNLNTGKDMTKRTDDEGILTFTPATESEFKSSPGGTYEIMVDNKENRIDGYCSTKETIIVKDKINKEAIKIVYPDTPMVDEQVTLQLKTISGKSAASIELTVTGSGFDEDFKTDGDGYIYFTPTSTGDYNIKVTDARYEEVIKTITIGAKEKLVISFSSDPKVGEKTSIVIKANGKAVSGATVKIKYPDGSQKTITTGNDGKTEEFTISAAGEYTISVEKSGYASETQKVEIYKAFNIEVPKSAKVGDIVTVKVLDDDNLPVSGATIKGENFELNEKTNADGLIEFEIKELKTYKISIKKTGFTTTEKEISTSGELKIKLNPEKVQLNKELIVTIYSGEQEISSDIKIIKPDKTELGASGSTYTFKPDQPGKYTVFVSKKGYTEVSVNFDVVHNVMNVSYKHVNGNLEFTVKTADGKPLKGAEVSIYTTTNEDGIAVLKLGDEYNLSVVKENYDPAKTTISAPTERDLMKMFMGILIVILIIIILILILSLIKKGGKKSEVNDKW